MKALFGGDWLGVLQPHGLTGCWRQGSQLHRDVSVSPPAPQRQSLGAL